MSGGSPKKCSDDDFVNMFREYGAAGVSKRLKQPESSVHRRRKNLEKQLGYQIPAPDVRNTRRANPHPGRTIITIENGHILVGSDAHHWPGPVSTGWRAFVALAKEFKPRVCCLNGDVLDFPQISRHPSIGWEHNPTVQEEIEHAQDCLNELEKSLGRGCLKQWNLGNHDGRFETRLATVAPEFARMKGFHLKDHFPLWNPAWSLWVNNEVVIKHRFKGGIHATHNNVIWAGKSMVTGHLHSAQVRPFTDYNGTRYGVDTGCLANPNHPAFVDYTEDNPKNWRSAFALLTFQNGKLLMPELVVVWDDNRVQFRGELIHV